MCAELGGDELFLGSISVFPQRVCNRSAVSEVNGDMSGRRTCRPAIILPTYLAKKEAAADVAVGAAAVTAGA